MALGLNQPLTEMSTRNIFWEQRWPVRRADNLTTIHMPIALKSGSLILLESSGPVQACNGIALIFTCRFMITLVTPVTNNMKYLIHLLTPLFAVMMSDQISRNR